MYLSSICFKSTSSILFGEMAILDGKSRSANALAQEKCECVTINREEFLNLLRNNYRICMNLLEEMAVRLRKSDQQIEALSLSDAEHRIGVSLLNLAVSFFFEHVVLNFSKGATFFFALLLILLLLPGVLSEAFVLFFLL